MLAASHGNAMAGACQFVLQPQEVFIGFELRIILHYDQQPAERAVQLRIGLDLLLRTPRSAQSRARIGDFLDDCLFMFGEAFDCLHQVRNQVRAALQGHVYLSPSPIHTFALGHQSISRAHCPAENSQTEQYQKPDYHKCNFHLSLISRGGPRVRPPPQSVLDNSQKARADPRRPPFSFVRAGRAVYRTAPGPHRWPAHSGLPRASAIPPQLPRAAMHGARGQRSWIPNRSSAAAAPSYRRARRPPSAASAAALRAVRAPLAHGRTLCPPRGSQSHPCQTERAAVPACREIRWESNPSTSALRLRSIAAAMDCPGRATI